MEEQFQEEESRDVFAKGMILGFFGAFLLLFLVLFVLLDVLPLSHILLFDKKNVYLVLF